MWLVILKNSVHCSIRDIWTEWHWLNLPNPVSWQVFFLFLIKPTATFQTGFELIFAQYLQVQSSCSSSSFGSHMTQTYYFGMHAFIACLCRESASWDLFSVSNGKSESQTLEYYILYKRTKKSLTTSLIEALLSFSAILFIRIIYLGSSSFLQLLSFFPSSPKTCGALIHWRNSVCQWLTLANWSHWDLTWTGRLPSAEALACLCHSLGSSWLMSVSRGKGSQNKPWRSCLLCLKEETRREQKRKSGSGTNSLSSFSNLRRKQLLLRCLLLVKDALTWLVSTMHEPTYDYSLPQSKLCTFIKYQTSSGSEEPWILKP